MSDKRLGECPNCGEDALFMLINVNGDVAFDCIGADGCGVQAATPLNKARKLMERDPEEVLTDDR